jgi:two-component system KDP operon response regulator KdpE
MGRILLAGGSEHQQRDLRTALEFESHEVEVVVNASQALSEVRFGSWDVLILNSDIDADPLAVCRTIRSDSNLGIIMLVADATDQCGIDALNAGADDYLPARFVFAELLAHVRAILRRVRQSAENQERIDLRDRAIDLRSHKVQGPGDRVSHLTPKEFLVLKYLIARTDRPVNHRELAQTVWNRDGSGDLEFVRIVIGQLRRKLEPDWNSPQYILTERSVGYRFTAAAYRTDSPATVR